MPQIDFSEEDTHAIVLYLHALAVVAEHEHIPICRRSPRTIFAESDDIRLAIRRNDRADARQLFMAFRHFLSSHPQAPART